MGCHDCSFLSLLSFHCWKTGLTVQYLAMGNHSGKLALSMCRLLWSRPINRCLREVPAAVAFDTTVNAKEIDSVRDVREEGLPPAILRAATSTA